MYIKTKTTKAELEAIVEDLPEYMRAAGQIIGILRTIQHQDYSPYRSVDDQRVRALKLAAAHFRLAL